MYDAPRPIEVLIAVLLVLCVALLAFLALAAIYGGLCNG
jgi:hypothetical protein